MTLQKNTTIDTTIKNHQDYIRIEGFVWEDLANSKDNKINNMYDETDALVEGINVYLYKGQDLIAQKTTDDKGWI